MNFTAPPAKFESGTKVLHNVGLSCSPLTALSELTDEATVSRNRSIELAFPDVVALKHFVFDKTLQIASPTLAPGGCNSFVIIWDFTSLVNASELMSFASHLLEEKFVVATTNIDRILNDFPKNVQIVRIYRPMDLQCAAFRTSELLEENPQSIVILADFLKMYPYERSLFATWKEFEHFQRTWFDCLHSAVLKTDSYLLAARLDTEESTYKRMCSSFKNRMSLSVMFRRDAEKPDCLFFKSHTSDASSPTNSTYQLFL